MRDAADAARAVAGMRHVFHVAADYRLWARDPEQIVRNNVAITRNVMLAALEARVGRVAYTSSVAALRPDPQGPADETRVATPAQAVGACNRSKVEAEQLVPDLMVHVDDVAEGHLMALERGRIGERHILGGRDVSLREMLAVIAGPSDRRAPAIGLHGAP